MSWLDMRVAESLTQGVCANGVTHNPRFWLNGVWNLTPNICVPTHLVTNIRTF